VESRAREYAKCVHEKGSPLHFVVGFIDRTAIPIFRPSSARQSATYSGHKRTNFLKFQAIFAPDGMVLLLFGPMEGRRHDKFLYNASGIDQILKTSLSISGRQYYTYVSYTLRPYLK
jgi:hypothetical protein